MSTRRFAAIAGGGTASHASLTVEIARALLARGLAPEQLLLVGSTHGREERVMAGQGIPLLRLSGRGLARSMSPAQMRDNLAALTGLAWATVRAVATFLRNRPRVVVGVGGYASLPAGLAAVALRIPLVVLNADVEPGGANRILALGAAACAVASPRTRLRHAVVTGVPLRQPVLDVRREAATRRAARAALGVPPDRKMVCFMGGSLGARRINRVAAALARQWSGREDLAVYHVTGRRDYEELARSARRGQATSAHGPSAGALWHCMVAFRDDVQLLYEAADLIVCRAGALTVAELGATGVPSVLVPLGGAPGDHQTTNAQVLADAGAAVLVPDPQCEPGRLQTLVEELLGDPARLEAMAKAAAGVGHELDHRHAAHHVADLVCAVAHGDRPGTRAAVGTGAPPSTSGSGR